MVCAQGERCNILTQTIDFFDNSMSTQENATRLALPRKAHFGIWLRKLEPLRRPSAPRRSLGAELERLARTAPHLLADLGFEEDRAARTPLRSVWRKGAVDVAISREPAVATVRVGHHEPG